MGWGGGGENEVWEMSGSTTKSVFERFSITSSRNCDAMLKRRLHILRCGILVLIHTFYYIFNQNYLRCDVTSFAKDQVYGSIICIKWTTGVYFQK